MNTHDLVVSTLAGVSGKAESLVQDDTAFRSLGLDMMDLVEAVIAIERKLDIELHDEDVRDARTVGDLKRAVHVARLRSL